MYGQYGLGIASFGVLLVYFHARRVGRYIVRKTGVQVSLTLRVAKRGARLFAYLGDESYRGCSIGLLTSRDHSHRYGNGMNLTHANETCTSYSNVFHGLQTMALLASNFQLGELSL